ncbi:B12-binding domain-containing radical SAM protei n [Desulfonema ishimotonii]|uniref:B12-binding domain-containing radical SAM protei n n=1 Tax=Desulfonema ishimotonii TaxID=45657 RepID=A0A401FRR1_9BACT|nr:radical SAM protein [Desulfonema ishimotonii]GBC59657.1 B12-binding domain-containing radical SAM protei n [Desulfonema ishimotonii]
MADILLIQPPVRDFYLTAKRTIPYGLACIASALSRSGFSVEIFDALATNKSRPLELPPEMAYLEPYYGTPDISPFGLFHGFRHFGYSFQHIGNIARASGAFLVGIASLFTAYSREAAETARVVRQNLPGCAIVLGGHHPTALPEASLSCGAADFAIRGEGEAALPLLAQAIRDGKGPESVPGIVFRKPGGGVRISPPAMMDHPDDYPLPAMNLVKQKFYRRKGRGSTVVTASRGCPMKCSYCSVGASSLKYRRRSVDSVLREIDRAFADGDAGFIDFEDENLSLNRDWFLALLTGIRERFGEDGPELRAMNGLFAPSLDETVIRAMKASGFRTLNLSLGSSSPAQLRRFRRPDVRPAVEQAIALAEKYGMEAVCYIIVGAPGQQAGDSVDDLLWLAARKALAGVSVFYPAPGSADYEKAEQSGLLPERFSLMRSSALPISHTTTRCEAATLLRLGRILNFIKQLRSRGEHLPEPVPCDAAIRLPADDRMAVGRHLLACFLHDGQIRGMTPKCEIFAHRIAPAVTERFLCGLRRLWPEI